jgi:hypothetical protein
LRALQRDTGEQPGELSPRRFVVHQVLPRLRQRLGLKGIEGCLARDLLASV